MPDIKAKISQSGLLKGNANSQNEIVASKVEVNTAGINLGDLVDVTITSPSDGSYVIFQNSSGTFIDDQTIVKTGTGITLTGSLAVTTNLDVDGILEADAITVNGIQLSEVISDTVGGMVDNNTESGIAVSYDDSTNTLDFDVADFSITLTGDVAGTGTVTNLGNVSFATTIQPNSVALGTDTTGDYVGTITGGTGIDSTAATSGEGTTHTLSIDLNELGTETSIAQTDFIAIVDATDNGSGKITLSDLEDEIFGNVSGDITIAAGGTATIQATSVENSMLAGSITNAKLANNTVNFGGVSVALGASDTTPAFDLQDASNLPTSALTGNMPNERIVAGNITQHEGSLSIATSQLTGTITNAQLAGTITNAKLQNSAITVSDGSNTSPVALGGTLTFTGTSNEVTVAESSGTVTIGLPDDVTIAGNLSLSTAPTAGAHVTNKTYVDAQVSALVDSAPETLNTLNELAAALGDDASFSTETANSLGNRLRIDVNDQSLTPTQKSNAITNLGLGTAATTASSNYATAAQGTKADSAIQSGDLATVATSGSYADLTNKPTLLIIGTSSTTALAGDTSLFSGDYDDLTNKPTLGTAAATASSNYAPAAGSSDIVTVGTLAQNTLEVVSTTDDANANPILSLHRNRANPAASDLIGEIQFNGEDSATNGNKTLYAAITARVSDETDPDEEDGQLFTYLAKQGVKTHITSVFNYGVVHQPGIHQYLTGTGRLQFAAGASGSIYARLYAVTPTDNRDILLPDASGTIVLKDSTDTLTNKSINANQLTDTIDNARLPAAATNITSVGNLSALTLALPAGTTANFLPVKLGSGSGIDAITDTEGNYNYAIGLDVLENLTSGTSNIGIGRRALEDTTSGSRNTVIGHISGQNVSTGNENVFIGYAVAESGIVTGSNNIGMVGPNLRNLTSGNHNIALGKQAGDHITTGSYNTALGFKALDGNSGTITGSDNIAIGREALFNNTTGTHNVGLGYQSLYSTDTGSYYNVGIGYQSGYNLTTGDYNYFVGHSAGKNATTGSHQLAIGYQSGGGAGAAAAGGNSSGISIGYRAAGNNVAAQNIALGYQALRNNDDVNSIYVVAIQREALFKARRTPYCVAIGYQSQYENVHSEDNVSIGENALKEAGYGIVIDATSSSVVDLTNNRFTISNTDFGYLNHRASGFHNNTRLRYYANGGTPIGGLTEGTSYYVTNDSTASAMYLATSVNKTSSNAVALSSLGVGSGHYFSINGEHNVAIGSEAGRYGRQFFQSVAIGSRAAKGTLNDCSHEGTTNVGYAAGHFSQKSRYATHMGYLAGYTATDNYMRTSIGARAGVYSTASYETAIGAYALSASSSANSTGDHNTAVGYASLNKNTSGKFNASVGSYSLYDNTTGQRNTVVGYNTAANVTTGSYNTVLGMQAGVDLTTGGYNTLVGSYAGDELIAGSNNTALGYAAYQHSAGKLNVAIGNGALGNTGGSGDSPYANTGVGASSLKSLQNGASGNTGLGLQALPGCTTGDYNIGIGYKSGENLTTGSYNIAIGRENDFSAASAIGQIAIGRGVATTENYQVAIGYTNGVIRNEFDTDATWTQSSDLRKKKNINDMNLGLEFIDKLRPITYQWKPNNELPEQFDEYAEENTKDTETVMSGLGAQDVKQALEEVGYTERFPGWKEDTDGSQRISKEEFVIPLINAIQELKAEVEMLKEKLNNGDS